MGLTLIGDLHGNAHLHGAIMVASERTLQVGDCGVDYAYLEPYDAEAHKVLPGNHDHYDRLKHDPHFLPAFGTWNGIFFVKGAWSIDRAYRTAGVDWWPEEEVTQEEMAEASALYRQLKPSIVVTHDGPPVMTRHLESIFPEFGRIASRTSKLLDELWECHHPREWYFGHWHQSAERVIDGTRFRCLDVHEVLTIEG